VSSATISTPASLAAPGRQYWKTVLADSFRDPYELLKYCGIDVSRVQLVSEHEFAFRVTRYFASLIEKGNAQDPLLLQVLPSTQELQWVDGYAQDAVGDIQSMRVPGLVHKYAGRVLLTLTGACAIHCRYCFRRHFPYGEARVDFDQGGRTMKYLAEHDDVREVILSGGDPLMISDGKLADLVASLNRIPHIKTLRIHSRLLSVLPERVTRDLVEVLQGFDGQVVMVTHINHPNEISERNQAAFQLLSKTGYRLFNQSVLLKGVNDSASTLVELSNRLFESHITPYYLHRLDKVQGAAHFDLPGRECARIYAQLRSRLPGYLLPAMVRDIPGQAAKTPATGE
jgi:EF-P beta-lysylation protein EpmB